MKRNGWGFVVQNALAIVGAIVGIGFVSGKEIVTFFFKFQGLGFLLAGLSCFGLFLCVVFMAKKDSNDRRRRCTNMYFFGKEKCNNEIICGQKNCKFDAKLMKNGTSFCKNNKNFAQIRNCIIGCFQVVISGCMIAGIFDLVDQVFESNYFLKFAIVVILLIVIFVLLMCLSGGVLKLSGIMTFVLISVMAVTLVIGFVNASNDEIIYIFDGSKSNVFGGVWSCVFYVSMNVLSCTSVIENLKKKSRSMKQVFGVVAIASVILFSMIFLIISIYDIYPTLVIETMPLLALARMTGGWLYSLYFCALFVGSVLALLSVCYSSIVSFGFENKVDSKKVGGVLVVGFLISHTR